MTGWDDGELRIKIPGLEIREPLTPRPLSGAAVGAAAGLLLGWLSKSAGGDLELKGSVIGGAAAGGLVGLCAPWFRSRWKSGLVVTVGASIALYLAMPSFRAESGAAETTFLGLCAGIMYASLFWDYRAARPEKAPPPDDA